MALNFVVCVLALPSSHLVAAGISTHRGSSDRVPVYVPGVPGRSGAGEENYNLKAACLALLEAFSGCRTMGVGICASLALLILPSVSQLRQPVKEQAERVPSRKLLGYPFRPPHYGR